MNDALIFENLPVPIKVAVIGGAFLIGPYIMVRAWLEGRSEKADTEEVKL